MCKKVEIEPFTSQERSEMRKESESLVSGPGNDHNVAADGHVSESSSFNPSSELDVQVQGMDETLPSSSTENGRRKSSRRILRKTCHSSSTVEVNLIGNLSDQESVSTSASRSKAKSSRKWEGWTEDDTKCFFVALAEHGKDFQSIQAFMAQKSEKKENKSSDLIKNRVQVRHYYYRTWHKITGCLSISDDVDKQSQELYGLINYGEIWKKFGAKTDSKIKLKDHLNELVYKGHTNIKFKGKVIKLKTPVCKALKKINKLEDSAGSQTNDDSLPNEISLELFPSNNSAWLRVHSNSQNPRARTKLPLQKRLAVLINYLEKRWSNARLRTSECLSYTGTSVESASEIKLKLKPHRLMLNELGEIKISKTPGGPLSHDISLQAYLNKFHKNLDFTIAKTKKSPLKNNQVSKANKLDEKKSNNEVITADERSSQGPLPITEAVRSLSLLKDMLASVDESDNNREDEEEIEEDDETAESDVNSGVAKTPSTDLPLPPANATLSQWLSGNAGNDKQIDLDSKEVDDSELMEVESDEKPKSSNHFSSVTHSLSKPVLEEGWDSESAGSMTIGELYLLLSRPEKILMEYDWEVIPTDRVEECSDKVDSVLEQEAFDSKVKMRYNSILNKLLTIAKIALTTTTQQQSNLLLSPTKLAGKGAPRKNKRLKLGQDLAPTVQTDSSTSSCLLYSVISDTILTNANDVHCVARKTSNFLPDEITKREDFVIPTNPAPKTTSKSKEHKEIDPLLVQEALKQLNSNKFNSRKHLRKPVLKPSSFSLKPSNPRWSPVTNSGVNSRLPIAILPAACTLAPKSNVAVSSAFVVPDAPLNTPESHSTQETILSSIAITQHSTIIPISTTTQGINANHTTPPTSSFFDSTILLNSNKSPPHVSETTCSEEEKSDLPSAVSSVSNFSSVGFPSRQHKNTILPASPPNINSLFDISLGDTPSLFGDQLCSSLSDALGLSVDKTISKNDGIESRHFESIKSCVSSSSEKQNADFLTNCVSSTEKLLTPEPDSSSSIAVKPVCPEHWLHGENSTLSLSSLFSTSESPSKTSLHSSVDERTDFVSGSKDESLRLSTESDTQIRGLVTDNSVDLIAKFSGLSEGITGNQEEC